MILRRAVSLLGAILCLLSLASPAIANSVSPPDQICGTKGCGGAATEGDTIRVGGTSKDLEPYRDRATPGGGGTSVREWVEVEEFMTPACGANGLFGGDALCMAAIASCPVGEIRFWVWQRVVRHQLDEDPPVLEGEWERLPGSYCLGADDPGVPDYGRAIARVQSGFQDLPLPRAAVEVAPAPTSLVQVPTAFFAGGAQSFEQTVTPVPGISVTVSARPTSWTWHWGDGTSGTFGTAGEPRRPVVAHTYRQVRDFSALVEVTWQGSFTIAGSSEVFDITTPAVVTSAPVTVQVREARSQLVDQS